jgi:tetratricopeptide (TPR) repeat protein
MKKLLVLFIVFVSWSGRAQETTLFDQGVEFYKEGQFERAITAWESILESGEHSAALYFNLGNAYFKIEQIAPSIYFYEKALQLDPKDKDILHNLTLAQNYTTDEIVPAPQGFFQSFYQATIGIFSFNGWAVLAILGSVLFAMFFIWYFLARATSKKRMAFSLSGISLVIAGLALCMAFISYGDNKNNRFAIVFAASSQVRNEPLDRSEVSFKLHSGTKVKITDTDADWVRIVIADGKEGWMPKQDLKEI